jgi:hypothetical protein
VDQSEGPGKKDLSQLGTANASGVAHGNAPLDGFSEGRADNETQLFLLTRRINRPDDPRTFDRCVPISGYNPARSYDSSVNAGEENLGPEIDVYWTQHSTNFVRRYFRSFAACQAAAKQYDEPGATAKATSSSDEPPRQPPSTETAIGLNGFRQKPIFSLRAYWTQRRIYTTRFR